MNPNLKIETLTDAGMRQIKKMDFEDVAALKLCLLSTGALFGLSLKNPFARRLAGLGCSVLAAGLAIPLVSQFLDELSPEAGQPELTPLSQVPPDQDLPQEPQA